LSKNVTEPVAVDGVKVASTVTWPVGGAGLGLTVSAIADAELEAAPMTMLEALLTPLVSCDVATLNVELG
jgi:hypothetical protein